MSEINHFEARIHPGYHCLNRKPQTIDRTHRRLTWLGDQRMKFLDIKPEALLFYFSPLSDKEIKNALKQEEPSAPVIEEIKRIHQGQKILGERFIAYSWAEHYFIDVAEELEKRGFTYHPQSSLYVYGEYLGFCVNTIGELVRQQLEIAQRNYSLVPELCRPGNHLNERFML